LSGSLYLFFKLCFFLVILLSSDISAQGYHYSDSENYVHKVLEVNKTFDGDSLLLTLKGKNKDSRHYFKPLGYTVDWKHTDQSLNHRFHAKREGHRIYLDGIYGGENIDKTITIDQKPWINKLDHGLSHWALSDESLLVFWTLKINDDLEPIEFEAEKTGVEFLETPLGTFEAIKVKLRLHGFLMSKLWSANCWYRQSDGLFLKYEGNSGPGTDVRTILIQRPSYSDEP